MKHGPYSTSVRVRYGDTDRMGSYFNAHALDWFEVGRTEAFRQMGLTYREMESRGLFLPIVDLQVRFRARADYDDLLEVQTTIEPAGRASIRFDMRIVNQVSQRLTIEGFTLHAMTDSNGRATRPPEWLSALLQGPTPRS